MIRKLIIAFIFLILFSSSNASASFYSSDYGREAGTVVAAVQIKGKGIYNLIVKIQFMRKPQDSKIYKSDEYEKFMDRLLIESRGIALKKILEHKEFAVSDLSNLVKVIETDIGSLATKLKKNLLPNQNIEVVFAITDFYLLEPRDR